MLYNKINDIKIIGGGSAGWMTAATLVRKLRPGSKITLIESPNISTVGVGESTIGGISNWMEILDINRPEEFIKETDGTIKLSIRFEDFYKKNDGGFHYPFGHPVTFGNKEGGNDWYYKKMIQPDTPKTDFADCMFAQMAMVNANTLSKNFPSFNYKGDKAYHFDATKFGLYLKDKICLPEGVQHVLGNVVEDKIKVDEDGNVSEITLDNGETYTADLWIDCTGFKSMLLGGALNEPFVTFEDMLPNNSAWATRLPYKDKKKELNLYTDCIAHNNGWVWKIPLWTRWGTGYVYSDKYISDEDAKEEFKQFIKDRNYDGLNVDELEFRKIKMRVGRHERIWVKNVCAIGLSAGFIEPLESNGLYSVHEFLRVLIQIIGQSRGNYSNFDRENFNFQTTRMFDGFASFVAMHYALSHRDDTPYWQDVQQRDFEKAYDDIMAKSVSNVNRGYLNHFTEMFYRKNIDKAWAGTEGMQCIAPGMEFNMIDWNDVMYRNVNNVKDSYYMYFKELAERLTARSLEWKIQAKKCTSAYDFLKNEFFDGKDDEEWQTFTQDKNTK